MKVISKKALREFWQNHPDAEQPLMYWYKTASRATWKNLAEARRDFPHADSVGICTVFNIAGNKYRLIAKIKYLRQIIYLRFVLTHAEYDKEGWKNDCDC